MDRGSAYVNGLNDTVVLDFPKKKVWSKLWLHEVRFFLWQLVKGRLLTIDNLLKRNCAIVPGAGNPSPNLCVLCDMFSETGVHLFWDCIFSRQ